MSNRFLLTAFVLAVFVVSPQSISLGRGFGGGGGGGFHGGGGGFGGGGFGGGGFHGGGGFGGGGYGGGGFGGGGYGGGGFGGGGDHSFGGGGFGGGGEFGGGDLGRGGAGEFGGGGDLGRGGAGEFGGYGGGAGRGEFGGGAFGGDAGRGNLGGGGFDSGRFGAGGYGAAPSRGQLNNFLGLPSDEGMHNMISNPYVHSSTLGGGINTQHGSYVGPNGGFAAGGAAEGPRGGEAGHGVVVGPNGGVVAGGGAVGPHGGEAAHGIAVGPNGRVAGGGEVHGPNGGTAARGFAAGPNGYAAGFARVSPSQRYATAGVVRGNYNHWNYFGPGWYGNHPGAWYCAGWAAGSCWWPCTWPGLYSWFAFPDVEPIYYDYGNTVLYQDDGVYVDGVDQGTPTEYYNQAQTLATNGAQAAAPSDGDWMPLGVFLLTKTGEKDSHDVFQLAVNKQGIIRGNFQDSSDDKTESVQGSVDMKTQRAAFTVGDKTSTVIETGLYNLTKDEAPVLIHFGADKTEQWMLVRLKNPDAAPPATANTATNAPADDSTATPGALPADEPF